MCVARFSLFGLLLFAPLVGAVQDPTRPFNVTSAPATIAAPVKLRLQSLLLGGQRRVAVLNGEPMISGQRGQGFTVLNIGDDFVRIRFHTGVERELRLKNIDKELE